MVDLGFYKGKRVLVTGHTGFKGAWLTKILLDAGANVTGFALEPPTNPSLFEILNLSQKINSVIGDVRDFSHLLSVFEKEKPECVFHLAAQPIVREGYKFPRETYETNVMGTVNLLECARRVGSAKSILNVTTDKVYLNKEAPDYAFREEDPLDGFDPYSNSKSCSELVTHSYKNSFFDASDIAVSSARAGNVIGGGDFAPDRIIPDFVRAVMQGKTLQVRNPSSTRPYQHVLEPLFVYLEIVEKQYSNKSYAGYYNVGPDEGDCVTTGELVEKFGKAWGEGALWSVKSDMGPHEAAFLKLDNSKIKKTFGWCPRIGIRKAIELTVQWTKIYMQNHDLISCEMQKEIEEYLNL